MALPEDIVTVGIPKADGTTEWWILTDQWTLLKTDPNVNTSIATHTALPNAHHPQTHSHPTHGNINFTGTVSADGHAGITGEYEGTFKKIKVQDGIVIEFELE